MIGGDELEYELVNHGEQYEFAREIMGANQSTLQNMGRTAQWVNHLRGQNLSESLISDFGKYLRHVLFYQNQRSSRGLVGNKVHVRYGDVLHDRRRRIRERTRF